MASPICYARSLACTTAVLALGLSPTVALATSFETVALTGEAIHGSGDTEVFSIFNPPVLNDSGQVAFYAGTTEVGSTPGNLISVWTGRSGTLRRVAQEGNPAPGTPAEVTFTNLRNSSGFTTPLLSDTGLVAFRGQLGGTGVDANNDRGIFTETSEGLTLLAREGDMAPTGSGGVIHAGLFVPLLSGAGQVAFSSNLGGVGIDNANDQAIYVSIPDGSAVLAAREGDPAPGTSGLDFRGVGSPLINRAGQLLFNAGLPGTFTSASAGTVGPHNTTLNNGALFRGNGASLEPVIHTQQTAPGTAPGTVFEIFLQTAFNDSGQIALVASAGGPNLNTPFNLISGLWIESGGTLSPVALSGDAAPGAPGGVDFADSFEGLVLNAAGRTAFTAELTGPDDSRSRGLFSQGTGTLNLVAREGDAAPDTNAVFRLLFQHTLNDAGQIAFRSQLSGTGVDRTNDEGLFATGPDGILQLIVRKGELFDVNDDPFIDDLRTILSITFAGGSGGGDGRGSAFNNAGQLAFELLFTDGTGGVFIATVPEPAGLGLLAAMPLITRRRR